MGKIHVISVWPGRRAADLWVDDCLDSYKDLLNGGFMETVRIFPDDNILLVCDDEGILKNLPLNRAIFCDSCRNEPMLIAGPFFLVAYDGPEFVSIPDRKIPRLLELFNAGYGYSKAVFLDRRVIP